MISLFLLLSTAVIVFYFENILNELETYFFPVIFIYFMYDFNTLLFPKFNKNISSSKLFKSNYKTPNKYIKNNLNNYVNRQNKMAILIFILYTIMIVLIALMYWKIPWFSKKYIYLIFFAINFGDYYCINIWCPFQKLFLRNKCCNTCRISNWDRLMKVSILLLIPNIYTIIINIIAVFIFLQWEYNHFKYPERFYSISNESLKCKNCNTQECLKNKRTASENIS